MTQVDRVPITSLPSRYGIVRSLLYIRLKDLNIKPEKDSRQAYVNAEQLAMLDALHAHIQKGGTTSEFIKQQGAIAIVTESTNQQLTSVESGLIKAIAYLMNQHPTDELQSRRQLKEVAEEGWRLSTSELLGLLMRSSIPPLDAHQRFSRMGFTFHRMGKVGRQYEWRVTKVQP